MRDKKVQRNYVKAALDSFCKTISEQYDNISYDEKTAMGPYGPEQVSPAEFCNNVMAFASFLYEEPHINTAANTLPIVLPMVETVYRIAVLQNVTDLAILSVLQAPGFTDRDVIKILDDPKRFENFLQKKKDLLESIDPALIGDYSYRMFREKIWSLEYDHEYPIMAECKKHMGENEFLTLCESPSTIIRRQLPRTLSECHVEDIEVYLRALAKDEDSCVIANVVDCCSDPETLRMIAERGTNYPFSTARKKLDELEKDKDPETEEGKEIE